MYDKPNFYRYAYSTVLSPIDEMSCFKKSMFELSRILSWTKALILLVFCALEGTWYLALEKIWSLRPLSQTTEKYLFSVTKFGEFDMFVWIPFWTTGFSMNNDVITNRFLGQIGHFTTQINPVITNTCYNEQKWPVSSCLL